MNIIFNGHAFLSIIVSFLCSVGEGGQILSQLCHYEVLTVDDFNHHVVRRSTGHRLRHVTFNALKKLQLWHDTNILAEDFQVFGVDDKGEQRREDIDLDGLYHGRLEDEPQSEVRVSIDEDGVIMASIKSQDEEIYTIEPSWPHLGEKTNKTSMIAYRKSDMNEISDHGDKYCGDFKSDSAADNVTRVQGDLENDKNKIYNRHHLDVNGYRHSSNKARPRRQTFIHNKCSLLLVADYKFFQTVGSRSLSKTSRYLIVLMDRVDSIYTKTEFGDFKNMGFQIKEIKIHKMAFSIPGHYNHWKTDWTPVELLQSLQYHMDNEGFCLQHLFTSQAFENGILGLAKYSAICSVKHDFYEDGKHLFFNTGFSSARNTKNKRLLTQEVQLLATHGHGWGSPHDPDTSECAPSSSDHGKYVMYPYSVTGYDGNNYKFSPCSRRSIERLLKEKAEDCFTEHRGAYCGNSHVEPSEECDPGPSLDDKCCDNRCRLKNGTVCSDLNHACCEGCQIASNATECYTTHEGTCEASTNCTGEDMHCPQPSWKKDGTTCKAFGKCSEGKCLSFCETQSLESCSCDAVSEACLFCCKDMKKDGNSTCQPYRLNDYDEPLPLPEGLPCLLGVCSANGTCERQIVNNVFLEFIRNLHHSKLEAYMRANMVGAVIILSLFLWIPASCLVCYVDRKQIKQLKEDHDWETSESLIHPADTVFVRQGSSIHRRNLHLARQRPLQGSKRIYRRHRSPPQSQQCVEPLNINAKKSYI